MKNFVMATTATILSLFIFTSLWAGQNQFAAETCPFNQDQNYLMDFTGSTWEISYSIGSDNYIDEITFDDNIDLTNNCPTLQCQDQYGDPGRFAYKIDNTYFLLIQTSTVNFYYNFILSDGEAFGEIFLSNNETGETSETYPLAGKKNSDIKADDSCRVLTSGIIETPITATEIENSPVHISSILIPFGNIPFIRFDMAFPCYSSPVDIYVAFETPDGALRFIQPDGKRTPMFTAMGTNTDQPVNFSTFLPDASQGDYMVYWAVVPTNRGDFAGVDWNSSSVIGFYPYTLDL